MDEEKVIDQLGFFGVLAFAIVLFIAFAICTCNICPTPTISTLSFPPSKVFITAVDYFVKNSKLLPESIPDLEREISGSMRAIKIARRVNQSEILKDFHPSQTYYFHRRFKSGKKLFPRELSLEEFWTKLIPPEKLRGDWILKGTLRFWVFLRLPQIVQNHIQTVPASFEETPKSPQ